MFKEKLKMGRKTEEEFEALVCNQFMVTYLMPEEKFSAYDMVGIYHSGDIKTFEIKDGTNVTTSVFIEFLAHGKPSGITITKADFYVFKLPDGFYYTKVNKLRRELDQDSITIRNNAGYKGLASGYIVPIETFKQIFTKI